MPSEEEERNLEVARQYIEVVGDPASTSEDLKAFLDQSVVWREMPNRFAPAGRESDLATACASFEKGRAYLPRQIYTIRRMVASRETVVLEISWTGEVLKTIGPFPAGTRLSAQLAIFLRFRDGKIISQTDYPCYDPVAE